MIADVPNAELCARERVLQRLRDNDLTSVGNRGDTRADVHGHAQDVVLVAFDLTDVDAAPGLHSHLFDGSEGVPRGGNRARGEREGREHVVAARVDPRPTVTADDLAEDRS